MAGDINTNLRGNGGKVTVPGGYAGIPGTSNTSTPEQGGSVPTKKGVGIGEGQFGRKPEKRGSIR